MKYKDEILDLKTTLDFCKKKTTYSTAGCNTLCIDLWRDNPGGGGKYLQSIHFGFAFGAFMGPLIAEPFLSIQQIPEKTNSSFLNLANTSYSVGEDEQQLNIFHLFPILGSISCIVSIWYLFYDITERIRCRIGPKDIDLSEGKQNDVKSSSSLQEMLFTYL